MQGWGSLKNPRSVSVSFRDPGVGVDSFKDLTSGLGAISRALDVRWHCGGGCQARALQAAPGQLFSRTGPLLPVGYQRQLTYRHQDGSYSAFGERDTSGSMW